MEQKIGIFGGGSWGTAISIHLAKKGYPVTVWDFNSEEAALIEKERFNGTFLPGIRLPDLVHFTPDAKELENADIHILAIPTQFIRSFLENNKRIIPEETPIISLSKGLENNTLYRVSEIISEFFKNKSCLSLSGPTHAEEVARMIPSAIVAASADQGLIDTTIELFRTQTFRVYPSDDIVGVEFGGVLKNIIAIGTGISDGLKLGDNTRAALMTRGLEEMRRIGVACGAKSKTFMGLSGMGDLIVTCSSNHSRNRRVGLALGQGKSLEEILNSMQMVAEGVKSTISAKSLCESKGIEAPIISAIYDVLYNDLGPQEALKSLMSREIKPEMRD